jgi:transposase
MTTSPYSLDLRERVIKFIVEGNTQTMAAKVFTLNLSTVSRWYLCHRKEGYCNPRKRLGAKSKIDKESLKSYIAKNPNATLQEVSREYGISLWGIYYWLKKLGFSYKKCFFLYANSTQNTINDVINNYILHIIAICYLYASTNVLFFKVYK